MVRLGIQEIVSKLSQRVSELQKAIEVRDDRISVLEFSVGGITSTSSHNQDASGVVAEALRIVAIAAAFSARYKRGAIWKRARLKFTS